MPVVFHPKPKKKPLVNGSALLENILVRLGIGAMVSVVGLFIGLRIPGAAIPGAVIGFMIGFALGDRLSNDWFTNIFGPRD
jgi:membrane associated rhomboid family serine protease